MGTNRSIFKPAARLALAIGLIAARSWAAAPAADDPGWPRVFEKDGKRIAIHQPQVDSWDSYRQLEFRCAVEVNLSKETPSQFGIIEVEAGTAVDRTARLVRLLNPKLEARFPGAKPEEAQKLEATVRGLMPNLQFMEISLDRVLAYMDATQAAQRGVEVSLDPPKILHSASPAILVMFMGPPRFKPAGKSGLMFATNTNWDVFLDPVASQYYLLNGEQWLKSADLKAAAWAPAGKLPTAFHAIPDEEMWKETKTKIPGKAGGAPPAVLVTEEPSELILTQGELEFSPIPGTALMAVANTDQTLFFLPAQKRFYFLASGRWFAAESLGGPWSAATSALPDDFKKIPEDCPQGFVLASVPGTPQAEDAILMASIPDMAEVDRKAAKIEVQYSGAPQFIPIEQTEAQCAINTYDDVFLVAGRYYCCREGVWFESIVPTGPWAVCVQVPQAIYAIPPGHPKHNVTYVVVYSSTPQTVQVGYTSGYYGQYVANGVVMFGAGLAVGAWAAVQAIDARWHGYEDFYHYHYFAHPHFYAYGSGAVYTGFHGGFVHGHAYYGPHGGAGHISYYNPVTGRYGRRGYAYTPYGEVHGRAVYNPRTDRGAAHIGGSGIYGSWGRTVVGGEDHWARAGRITTDRGTARWAQTSAGGKAVGVKGDDNGAFVAKGAGDNVYAGANGNVYRREEGGGWQKWESGGWEDAGPDMDRPQPERGSSSPPGHAERPESRPAGQPSTMDRKASAPGGSRPSTLESDLGSKQGGVSELRARPATADAPASARMERDARARAYGNNEARQNSPSRSAQPSRSRSSTSSSSRSGGSSRGGGGGRRR